MLKLVPVSAPVKPEVNWGSPAMTGNPYLMSCMWGMAITKTLMEAHQKKMINFMTTGVWK